jgi:hypothetical protein
MLGADILSTVREDMLRDAARPYLWSDDLIYRFLNEAQDRFCRRTFALLDDESDLATFDTEIGVASYALDPKVLMVNSARLSTQPQDLYSRTRQVIPTHLATSTGMPSIFTQDEAAHKIRLYPVPDAVYTVVMRVSRLPLTQIADAVAPEIPEQYHLDLAEWAVYRCLNNNDPDGSNAKAAENFRKTWTQRLLEANREYYRIRLNNNPLVRQNWTGKQPK